MTISSANNKGKLDGLQLITDSQEVEAVFESIGKLKTMNRNAFGGLFVEIKDGEYGRIYAFRGCIPAALKALTKVH